MSTFFHRPRNAYRSRLFIPKLLLPFFKGRVECWKALVPPRSRLRSYGLLHGKPTVGACSERSRFHNGPCTDRKPNMPVQHLRASALIKKHRNAVCCECRKEAVGDSEDQLWTIWTATMFYCPMCAKREGIGPDDY